MLAGINDTDEEIGALKPLIQEIQPEKIQLNTVVRPPADPLAKALDRRRLEEIKLFLGERAEIVVDIGAAQGAVEHHAKGDENSWRWSRRRPLRVKDMAGSLGLSVDEVESMVKGLLIKGYLRCPAGRSLGLKHRNFLYGQSEPSEEFIFGTSFLKRGNVDKEIFFAGIDVGSVSLNGIVINTGSGNRF